VQKLGQLPHCETSAGKEEPAKQIGSYAYPRKIKYKQYICYAYNELAGILWDIQIDNFMRTDKRYFTTLTRIIFILTTILFSINSYGQQNDLTKFQDTVFMRYNKDETGDSLKYGIDTIIFETAMRRHILTGSTILTSTHNQYAAKWDYGLYFNDVTKSNCDEDATLYGGSRLDHINSITSTDTTLTVDINIDENCCYDFLCDISVVDSSIINLIYYGYGTHCDCDCGFGLTFHITKEKKAMYKKMKSVMINGNRKTLKPIKRNERRDKQNKNAR